MKIYAEEQLAAHGWVVVDLSIAQTMRPSLWNSHCGDDEAARLRLIAEAQRDGQLFNATIKIGQPGDKPKIVVDTTGIVRRVMPEDQRTVQIIARSKAKLAERLGWMGFRVESVKAWVEPEAEPVPDAKPEPMQTGYPFGGGAKVVHCPAAADAPRVVDASR
ncbi:hypothetical protein CCR95_20925 [Thiocystis minor]|nr:hypothetical protein [Thiocystis minor]